MKPSVQILMATYNGAAFLREQLDSILSQDMEDWSLLVRDDASTDTTRDIIGEFECAYPEKIEVVEDGEGGRIGPYASFLNLMTHVSSDYACFCDQDDVWFSNKLSCSIEEMQEMEKVQSVDTPLLVHHDVSMIGTDRVSYHDYYSIKPENTSLERLALMGAVHGMTAMFNQALVRRALPAPSFVEAHDHYISLVASAFGKISYIPEPLADYRVHSSNTSEIGQYHRGGLRAMTSSSERIKNKLHMRSDAAKAFVERFDGELNLEQLSALRDITGINQQNWFQRKRALIRSGPKQVLNSRSLLFLMYG